MFVVVVTLILALTSRVMAQESTQVIVRVYSNLVTLSASDGGTVRAELWRENTRLAVGQGDVRAGEEVHIPLFADGFPGRPVIILPGHRLVLTGPMDTIEISQIPFLATDIDPKSRKAVVLAPAGEARLVLRRGDGANVVDRAMVIDTIPFGIDLADSMLKPGDMGELVWRDKTQSQASFVLPIGVFSALVRWDLNRIEGVDSAGNVLHLSVLDSNGVAKASATTVEVRDEPIWKAALASGSVLMSGDQLKIGRGDRLVPDLPDTETVTLPQLVLKSDLATGKITGEAPPLASVEITVRRPNAVIISHTVQVNADGQFAITLPAGQLIPGTWVAADYRATPEITIRREVIAARLQVALDTTLLSIDGQPGMTANVSLHHTADGRNHGATARVQSNGRAALQLPVDVEPGDTLQYYLDDGPVVHVNIPQLTTEVDALARTISGEAPAGTMVELSVVNVMPAPAPIVATADASGRYRVVVPPQWDLVPGSNGIARTTISGADVFRLWSHLRLEVEIGSPYVIGNPGVGDAVRLGLHDTVGKPFAEGNLRLGSDRLNPLSGFVAYWVGVLRDADGLPVPLATGDTLVVDADGVQASVVLPPLGFEINPDEDRIDGLTVQNATVDLNIEHQVAGRVVARESGRVLTGVNGQFEHEYSDFDLRAGDTVIATLTMPEGHRVRKRQQASWLYLRLDNGTLSGTLTPDTVVDAHIVRGTSIVGRANGITDNQGAFDLLFQDSEGNRVLPREGDLVDLDVPGQPPNTEFEIVVHDVDFDWDLDRSSVAGSTQASGEVALVYEMSYVRPGESGMTSGGLIVQPDASGRWSVDLRERNIRLVPGARLEVIHIMPSGHRIGRQHYVPQFNFQIDGPRVHGRGDSFARMEIELLDASGSVLGRTSGNTSDEGVFDLVMTGATGNPISLQSGVHLRVTSDRHVNTVRIPSLEVMASWTPVTVWEVLTEPGQIVNVWQRPGCRPGEVDTSLPGMALTTDQSGRHIVTTRSQAAPGTRVEISVEPLQGWRFYRLLIRPLLVIQHGHAVATGCASSLSTVTITLRDDDANVLGQGTATTDADGRFSLGLESAVGDPVAVVEGSIADFVTSSESAEVEAESLWLYRKPDSALVGGGAPLRQLVLLFALRDGRRVNQVLRTKGEGEYAFSHNDLPLEADWSPNQAEGIWAFMATANDHFVGAVAVPEPIANDPGYPLYLPLCLDSGA